MHLSSTNLSTSRSVRASSQIPLIPAALSALLILLLLAATSLPARAQGTKWAILVGVDEYENSITRLNYAVADVKAVASALRVNAGFAEENMFVMTSDIRRGSMRPTHINVIKQLSILAEKVKPEDTLLFYFAGHGFMRGGKNQFLATVNADPFDVDTLLVTSLPMELLKGKMERIKARQVIFIIDACRNDPAPGRGEEDNVRTLDLSTSAREVVAAAGGGISSTALWFACQEGQRSWEWENQRQGVFSYYVCEALANKKGTDEKGRVTMNRLASYVTEKVGAWARANNKTQVPTIETKGTGEIVLAEPGSGSGAVAVTPANNGTAVPEATLKKARLKIITVPDSAQVIVDGTVQDDPADIVVTLGADTRKIVRILVTNEGYKEIIREISLKEGDNPTQRFTLEKADGGANAATRFLLRYQPIVGQVFTYRHTFFIESGNKGHENYRRKDVEATYDVTIKQIGVDGVVHLEARIKNLLYNKKPAPADKYQNSSVLYQVQGNGTIKQQTFQGARVKDTELEVLKRSPFLLNIAFPEQETLVSEDWGNGSTITQIGKKNSYDAFCVNNRFWLDRKNGVLVESDDTKLLDVRNAP